MRRLRSLQGGEFLMARALLLVLILLSMLIIPLWMKRGNDDKINAGLKAAGTAEPRQIGHNLTFAPVPFGGKAAADLGIAHSGLTHLGCRGEPKPVGQPHQNSCNPHKVDTSCRIVLPVMCFQGKGVPQPPNVLAAQDERGTGGMDGQGGSGGSGSVLGAIQPVIGAILTSVAPGSARCEKETGTGWRAASFHDAGGWGMQGQRGLGLRPNTRCRVNINDQPGNCWDSRT